MLDTASLAADLEAVASERRGRLAPPVGCCGTDAVGLARGCRRRRATAEDVCLVLEGELRFGDLPLAAGDFPFARKGHRHPTAGQPDSACLLYIGSRP